MACCDGTANEFARDATNVFEPFAALVRDPERQVARYSPSVGTAEASGALTSTGRKVTKLLGKAIGYKLEAEVANAYASVIDTRTDPIA